MNRLHPTFITFAHINAKNVQPQKKWNQKIVLYDW